MFMDIEMPEMNGDAVMSATAPPYPVVAMTGNAALEDRERFLRVGFRQVLPKPFDASDFKKLIAALVGPPTTALVISPTAPRAVTPVAPVVSPSDAVPVFSPL